MGLSPASQRLLAEVRTTVTELCASEPGKALGNAKVEKLRSVVFSLKTSIGLRQRCRPSEADQAILWDTVCDLWNLAVERHNHAPDISSRNEQELRQAATDMLALLSDDILTDEGRATQLEFLTRTGQLWQKQGEHELAEGCFATAMVHAATLAEACASTALADSRRQQLVDALATLYTARAQAAWALQQEELADEMLQRANELAGIELLSGRQAVKLSIQLAHVLVLEGEKRLDSRQFEGAISILDAAYQLMSSLASSDGIEHAQAAVSAMLSRVLKLLADAYLKAGQPGPALNCVQALRDVPDGMQQGAGEGGDGNPAEAEGSDGSGSAAVAYLALQALLALGRGSDAQAELLALASAKDALLSLCMSAVKDLVASGEEAELAAVPAVAEVLRGRFPQDPALPVGLVQVLLAGTTGDGDAAEAAALDLLHDDATMELPAEDHASMHRQQLFATLWNRATERFYAKHYEACNQLYSAAMQFCSDDAQRAKSARLLALCSLASDNPSRALEYLEIATGLEPDNVYNAFVRFKVLLAKGDTEAAIAEIQRLMNCRGFDPDILRVKEEVSTRLGQDNEGL